MVLVQAAYTVELETEHNHLKEDNKRQRRYGEAKHMSVISISYYF
jgi:hypothetical protein